jgi:hypothetical protein
LPSIVGYHSGYSLCRFDFNRATGMALVSCNGPAQCVTYHYPMDKNNIAISTFITKWQGTTASELSTSQSFLIALCHLLGVAARWTTWPDPNGWRASTASAPTATAKATATAWTPRAPAPRLRAKHPSN